MHASRILGLFLAAALPVAVATAPGVVAQPVPELPPGVSVPDLGQSFAVPAGTASTVDLGIPVIVNYNRDGWVVVSRGTSVSVTAPATPGAQAAVPVSYAGRSATITLVAEGDGAVDDRGAGPADGAPPAEEVLPPVDGAPEGGAAAAEGGTDTAEGGAAAPDRAIATPVESAGAERLDFDAVIDGRAIVVELGLLEAAELYTRFRDTSRDGLKVRYLDSGGGIIQGVERDIDQKTRTLTLTYPEGQVPDNPFIIELVRDGGTAEAIVTLTAPGATTDPAGAREGDADDGGAAAGVGGASAAGKVDRSTVGVAAVGLALGLLALIAVGTLRGIRSRRR